MKYLIIIDMQNDFLTGPLGNDHCRKAIPKVCRLIKDKEQNWNEIILTRDTHFENYSRTLEGQKLPVEHCMFGSQGWGIDPQVMQALNDRGIYNYAYVNKPTFGSYRLIEYVAQDLASQTGYLGLNDPILNRFATGENLEFHVCGVCTSICVLANVILLRAKYPDAKIVVHANACGDVTKEMHDAALICFKSQQCEVVED